MEKELIIKPIKTLFEGVDEHDWLTVINTMDYNVFADYASLNGSPGTSLPSLQLVENWKSFLPGFGRTKHQISDFQIKQNRNTAEVNFHGSAEHFMDDEVWTVEGTYEVGLVKKKSEWIINAIKLNLIKQSGNLHLPEKAKEQLTLKSINSMKRVTFKSEGMTLVGNIYLPPNYTEGEKYPAIIVGGSWTTVKEQMAGLYASKLAEHGFITLAFDHRNFGESEGEPRFLENPESKSIDFSNAVSFLAAQPMVNADRIGGMAVCASGGYMAKTISEDPRFKSFAMVVPWFNTDEIVNAFYGGLEGIQERLNKSKKAMESFEATGQMFYTLSISDTDPSAAMFGPFEYYLNPSLGQVANWSHDKFALASWEPWLTYRPMQYATSIKVPTLMITSKDAATPKPNEDFYNLITAEKEIHWLEGGQLDFYYKEDPVNPSLDLISKHFQKHLN